MMCEETQDAFLVDIRRGHKWEQFAAIDYVGEPDTKILKKEPLFLQTNDNNPRVAELKEVINDLMYANMSNPECRLHSGVKCRCLHCVNKRATDVLHPVKEDIS